MFVYLYSAVKKKLWIFLLFLLNFSVFFIKMHLKPQNFFLSIENMPHFFNILNVNMHIMLLVCCFWTFNKKKRCRKSWVSYLKGGGSFPQLLKVKYYQSKKNISESYSIVFMNYSMYDTFENAHILWKCTCTFFKILAEGISSMRRICKL